MFLSHMICPVKISHSFTEAHQIICMTENAKSVFVLSRHGSQLESATRTDTRSAATTQPFSAVDGAYPPETSGTGLLISRTLVTGIKPACGVKGNDDDIISATRSYLSDC